MRKCADNLILYLYHAFKRAHLLVTVIPKPRQLKRPSEHGARKFKHEIEHLCVNLGFLGQQPLFQHI